MGRRVSAAGPEFQPPQRQAIRFLVESALRRVSSALESDKPQDRSGWVDQLSIALMSASETSHRAVLASMLTHGITQQDIQDYFVPAAARRLGELWVHDQASFVDVTVGAGRLQALYREHRNTAGIRFDRSIPLGETLLMVVPSFEDHSLGAFVAADHFRRHGVWVHMSLGMSREEIVDLLGRQRFTALGISAATWNTLEKTTELIDYFRAKLDHVPPVVVGGRAVSDTKMVAERTGADYAVRTAREAVERCGLSTFGSPLKLELMG